MAATDGQIIVAAARWSDEATYLREFVSKYRLPTVIKITKGQYGGLGVPTLPAPSLQSTALLLSAGRRRKIVAQAVKIKEGRRVIGVGPRLAIPDSYQGYFEILSEEGRAVRGIESVNELSRKCPEEGALVRETIRGIACKIEDETIIVAEGSKTIITGETLSVAGEVTIPGRGKFLRCVDSHGDSVLFSMEQRCRFSALAREDNISGVHTAKALLSKRLPLTVRLVHGQPPRGLKSSSHFLPELRLLSTFEEEHVFALPLQSHSRGGENAVALPLAAPLKLVKSRNEEALKVMPELTRLVDRATRLVADVADKAHVLDGRLGDGKSRQSRNNGFLRRSSSSDSATNNNNHHHHQHHHHHHHKHNHHQQQQQQQQHHHHHYHYYQSHQTTTTSNPATTCYRDENRVPIPTTEEYDEIDQIYDYVRGFAPLPKSVGSSYKSQQQQQQQIRCNAPSSATTTTTTTTCPSPPLLTLQHSPSPPPPPPLHNSTSIASAAAALTPLPTFTSALAPNPITVTIASSSSSTLPSPIIVDDRPEPPPIETIPTKINRNHAEKRTRRTEAQPPIPRVEKPPLAKLYIKNGTQRGGRPLLKSNSPIKETTLPSFKSGSPLFNIRYKSLTNLQQAMELDGTLDSSHSGGRTSGDSGAKLPEKRSRRLSRPRSLTNLVWELRSGNNCARTETSLSNNIASLIPPSKCGQRLAVTVMSPRRIGTLYL
ncbi:uncharacterized protein LOC122499415 [Leptopilina heterotoma]|uniref:uncharacterized protein LOC122499415 n=1 Tax=Leptopilina heterotoma TaxID=63436 RepID=UPI001CA927A3|nr:uncharacterized protein LOC122499415 [Leptopilina heterotoma]XP_043463689.1 uncharacterized protein LOC122499415 [Leptopilina heterotoma]XP_043463690.1 uncharacterized protein LOC122499415 [Leptopilina heterotoma]XP_043463691.1 uncharacterized protein LOC122499415 [Leptopilina heterotoma]XP_043463692.1 uncharacterized protein LOC122499415 [Leptopilina heterotoma]XP_043463693.1 uncharacterized protein LOC122499415 [Leptopilina heterotoma]